MLRNVAGKSSSRPIIYRIVSTDRVGVATRSEAGITKDHAKTILLVGLSKSQTPKALCPSSLPNQTHSRSPERIPMPNKVANVKPEKEIVSINWFLQVKKQKAG
ncbi:MAG: hypothetical protein QXK94_08240 [Candidatus Jordarchaeales archaeon]